MVENANKENDFARVCLYSENRERRLSLLLPGFVVVTESDARGPLVVTIRRCQHPNLVMGEILTRKLTSTGIASRFRCANALLHNFRQFYPIPRKPSPTRPSPLRDLNLPDLILSVEVSSQLSGLSAVRKEDDELSLLSVADRNRSVPVCLPRERFSMNYLPHSVVPSDLYLSLCVLLLSSS